MSLDALRDTLPEAAKDIRLNLSSLANEAILTDQQKWGSFLVAALASGHAGTIKAINAAATQFLTPDAKEAARAAHAIMAMNNIYYRSTHLLSNPEYGTLRASLRMNVLANPGVEKIDFELWSLAVSAVNGCGMCLDSHEKVLRGHGVTAQQVQAAIRIAAVVHAASKILIAEEALAA